MFFSRSPRLEWRCMEIINDELYIAAKFVQKLILRPPQEGDDNPKYLGCYRFKIRTTE